MALSDNGYKMYVKQSKEISNALRFRVVEKTMKGKPKS